MQKLNPHLIHCWWLIQTPFQVKYGQNYACKRHKCSHVPRESNPICKQCIYSLPMEELTKVLHLLTEEEFNE
jgi:hypothetical protein